MARIKETCRTRVRVPSPHSAHEAEFRAPAQERLCAVCRDATRRISRKLAIWTKIRKSDERLVHKSWRWTATKWPSKDEKGRLLPDNIIKHVARARNLFRSADSCRLCFLIKNAIVVSYALRASGKPLQELPLSTILQASSEYDEVLLSSQYAGSRVYLGLTRFQKYDYDVFKRRMLESIAVIVKPRHRPEAPYGILRGFLAVSSPEGNLHQSTRRSRSIDSVQVAQPPCRELSQEDLCHVHLIPPRLLNG